MLLKYSVVTGVVVGRGTWRYYWVLVVLGQAYNEVLVVTRYTVPAYILTVTKSHEKKWPGSSSQQVTTS